MNENTVVSSLTTQDLINYIRIVDYTESDLNMLSSLLEVAKNYIISYTGCTSEDLDTHQDFVIVVLILVQSMWDDRTMYVDKANMNKAVETILNMHSKNLLPNNPSNNDD